MSRPKISVCIATYNQADLIETCLRSVLQQQVDADLEILVGDDASTDDTPNIIATIAAEYPGVVQPFLRRENIGAFRNMHDLLTRASGDYIARVDGDDYWLPGKLAQQLAWLQTHPQCVAVYSNAVTVDQAGNIVGCFNDVGDLTLDLQALYRRGNFLNNSSVLFSASCKDAWTQSSNRIDYQVHLAMAMQGTLHHIGKPLAAYRIASTGSLVANHNERIRELYWQAILSVPPELLDGNTYLQGRADFLRRVLFRAIRLRNPSLFRRWLTIVSAATAGNKLMLLIFTAQAFVRAGMKELISKLLRRPVVLYRR